MTTATLPATDAPLACRTRPQLFHPPISARGSAKRNWPGKAEAIGMCLNCPLRQPCRDMGRELRETGIWGGEDDQERTDAGYRPRPARYHVIPERPGCGTTAAAAAHRRARERVCPSCLAAEGLARKEHEAARPTVATGGAHLRPRETAVLAGFAAGRTRAQISADIGITPKGLSRILVDLRAVLQVHDDAEMVPAAQAHGLLPAVGAACTCPPRTCGHCPCDDCEECHQCTECGRCRCDEEWSA